MRPEVTGDWDMFHNEAFHKTYASRSIDRFVKSLGRDTQTLRETGKGRQGGVFEV
jgi:hypothetical protein